MDLDLVALALGCFGWLLVALSLFAFSLFFWLLYAHAGIQRGVVATTIYTFFFTSTQFPGPPPEIISLHTILSRATGGTGLGLRHSVAGTAAGGLLLGLADCTWGSADCSWRTPATGSSLGAQFKALNAFQIQICLMHPGPGKNKAPAGPGLPLAARPTLDAAVRS